MSENEYKKIQLGPKEIKIPKVWQYENITNYVKFKKGSEPGRKNYCDINKGIPFYRVGDLSNKNNDYLVHTKLKNIPRSKKGDILISLDGSLGIVRKDIEGAYSSGIRKVKIRNNKINYKFVYYLLKSKFVQTILNIYSIGTTIKHGSKSIKYMKIPVPPKNEQKKIADILGSVDRAIEKTDEVIEKTEKLKKGLMQKLLTKGIGHDEFKEVRIGPKTYEIPEEWEILSLKKVSKIKGGGTPQRSVKEYWEGKIPWLTLSNISTKNKNFISKTDEYITEKALNESSAKLLPSGTIMISSRATIGEGVINRVPMTTNQGFVNIICDKSKFYNLYGLYLLRSFKNYLISLAGGSTFLEISKKSFRNIDVFIPKIKEQKLIANILLNIDNKIKKEKKYKEKLERLKKGLMQKLLTGKIRVKTANSE